MRLKEIVRSPKRIVGTQRGEPSNRVPKTAFPLSRNQSWRPGLGWDWWSAEFEASGQQCRLLVMLHEPKRIFRAWLGVQHGSELAVMARLEYEPCHPGQWHCHACCEDSRRVPWGVVKHPASRKSVRLYMPRHRASFDVTRHNALATAMKFFGVSGEVPDVGLFNA